MTAFCEDTESAPVAETTTLYEAAAVTVKTFRDVAVLPDKRVLLATSYHWKVRVEPGLVDVATTVSVRSSPEVNAALLNG